LSESLISTQSVIKASKNGIILNKVNPFNGTLLHRELIKDVGFIKKEMFIWGDETEYFKRIEAFGYNYATVTAALFYHPTSKTNISKKLFGILKVQRKPEKLEMNFIRNQGYINVRYNSFLSHKVALIYFIYFLLDGTVNKAFISLAYYMDGMFNNFKLKNFR
jgi:rhamnopyranosyl-N-acetylglucosaminyl-diphospho-decaprenol beta-1,3/1,4-galactofuranosyltransferase